MRKKSTERDNERVTRMEEERVRDGGSLVALGCVAGGVGVGVWGGRSESDRGEGKEGGKQYRGADTTGRRVTARTTVNLSVNLLD